MTMFSDYKLDAYFMTWVDIQVEFTPFDMSLMFPQFLSSWEREADDSL